MSNVNWLRRGVPRYTEATTDGETPQGLLGIGKLFQNLGGVKIEFHNCPALNPILSP